MRGCSQDSGKPESTLASGTPRPCPCGWHHYTVRVMPSGTTFPSTPRFIIRACHKCVLLCPGAPTRQCSMSPALHLQLPLCQARHHPSPEQRSTLTFPTRLPPTSRHLQLSLRKMVPPPHVPSSEAPSSSPSQLLHCNSFPFSRRRIIRTPAPAAVATSSNSYSATLHGAIALKAALAHRLPSVPARSSSSRKQQATRPPAVQRQFPRP